MSQLNVRIKNKTGDYLFPATKYQLVDGLVPTTVYLSGATPTISSLVPNTNYIGTALTSLTVSATTKSSLQTTIQFTTSAAFTPTLPNDVKWIGAVPSFMSGGSYLISIINNIAAAVDLLSGQAAAPDVSDQVNSGIATHNAASDAHSAIVATLVPKPAQVSLSGATPTIASLQANTVYTAATALTSLTVSAIVNSDLQSTLYFTTGTSFTAAFPATLQWVGTAPEFQASTNYVISFWHNMAVAGVYA